MRFRSGLHLGMTRGEVEALAKTTHGDTSISVTPIVEFKEMQRETDAGVLLVHYSDERSLCTALGPLYHLHFDKLNRLSSWNVTSWVNTC